MTGRRVAKTAALVGPNGFEVDAFAGGDVVEGEAAVGPGGQVEGLGAGEALATALAGHAAEDATDEALLALEHGDLVAVLQHDDGAVRAVLEAEGAFRNQGAGGRGGGAAACGRADDRRAEGRQQRGRDADLRQAAEDGACGPVVGGGQHGRHSGQDSRQAGTFVMPCLRGAMSTESDVRARVS